MEELKEAIKNISNRKQPEPDKIFVEFIKNLGPKAIDTLLIIYNEFRTSNMSLPAGWTKAMIIPILKPGKPTEEMTWIFPVWNSCVILLELPLAADYTVCLCDVYQCHNLLADCLYMYIQHCIILDVLWFRDRDITNLEYTILFTLVFRRS